jgi:hypothetical protein
LHKTLQIVSGTSLILSLFVVETFISALLMVPVTKGLIMMRKRKNPHPSRREQKNAQVVVP